MCVYIFVCVCSPKTFVSAVLKQNIWGKHCWAHFKVEAILARTSRNRGFGKPTQSCTYNEILFLGKNKLYQVQLPEGNAAWRMNYTPYRTYC